MSVALPGWVAADALARMALDGALAIVLGLVIGWAYARAYRGILLSTSFVHTCAVTVLLVAFAVAAVREAGAQAQALGFALVGLLGLIRFRTVVRDTREFSFVFLAIVTGVMVGSGHEAAAVLGCGAALGLLIALEKTGFGTPSSLALRARVTGEPGRLASYAEALVAIAERVEPVGLRARPGEKTVYAFEFVGRPGRGMADVGEALAAVPGTGDVAISRIQRGKGGGTDED